MTPSASAYRVGMWKNMDMAEPSQIWAINRKPVEITKDQLLPLYLMLYPYMVSDFSHRSDIQNLHMDMKEEMKRGVEDTNEQLANLKGQLDKHAHYGNLGLPTTPAIALGEQFYPPVKLSLWKALPEDDKYVFAEKLIVSSSPYSKNIQHRDPLADNENVKDKGGESVPSGFKKVIGSVPFDISGLEDEFLTEDEYAGSRS